MSLLTVDVGGPNETVLPFAKAGHAEPRTVGKRRYAFAGNERSMIRSEPMVIPLVGANLPAATVATLRSIFALGAKVLCAGDVFNNGGVAIYCSGELADEMEQGNTFWIPTLTLHEVGARTGGILTGAVSVSGRGGASVLINGPRYSTIGAAGAGAASVAMNVLRGMTATAAGQASTSARTTTQNLNVLAAGAATASARTQRQQTNVAASGQGSASITLTKIP